MQKSYRAEDPGQNRPWFIVDAKGKVIGRLAVLIANKLRAKDKPSFDPSVDAGAFVVVINAREAVLTGRRAEKKTYSRYSGYRGGLKIFTAETMRERHPERMILEAVRGMLPKNNIARKMMTRVKVYPGAEHPHAAQNPVKIEL